MCTNPADVLLSILAILFPPIAVWVKRGLCSADSLINLALCMLGFLPGLLHAWYVIATTPDTYEYEEVVDVEGGRAHAQGQGYAVHGGAGGAQPRARDGSVSYYYVNGSVPSQQFPQQQGGQLPYQGYGSMGPSVVGAGDSAGKGDQPPTYDSAIKGDNKVQRS